MVRFWRIAQERSLQELNPCNPCPGFRASIKVKVNLPPVVGCAVI